MKRLPSKKTLRNEQSVKTNRVVRNLYEEIRTLVESTRGQVAQAVNSGLVALYWRIGTVIRKNVLGEERAEYGQRIVYTLSIQLTAEYGRGFTDKALFQMIRFSEIFPDRKILHMLCAELSWSHIRRIMYLEDELKRMFYLEMCRVERWSVRVLEEKISSLLFERTAISKKPAKLIKQELKSLRDEGKLSPDMVFRDPYLLGFLGLRDTYAEKDLEQAILREMESFILELGSGFSFVARQKKISVDGEDYFLDLLFYHRTLRRLIAVELKLGKFKPAFKGQMELYLRWLEKYEMQPEEKPPLGLILCAGKSDEQIELLQLEKSGIRVSQYFTELPPRKLLEKRLHQAIVEAKEQVTQRKDDL